MISNAAVALALAGSLRERLPADNDLSNHHSSSVATQTPLRTHEDVEEYFTGPRLAYIVDALDTDADGQISPWELAELELKGADALSVELSCDEAFILADGAVREDGELDTAYVPEEHIREWVVAAYWANLSRGDTDGNGVLDDSELEVMASIADEELAVFEASRPSDGHLMHGSHSAASSGEVALEAAGEVLGRIQGGSVGERRRIILYAAYCWMTSVLNDPTWWDRIVCFNYWCHGC